MCVSPQLRRIQGHVLAMSDAQSSAADAVPQENATTKEAPKKKKASAEGAAAKKTPSSKASASKKGSDEGRKTSVGKKGAKKLQESSGEAKKAPDDAAAAKSPRPKKSASDANKKTPAKKGAAAAVDGATKKTAPVKKEDLSSSTPQLRTTMRLPRLRPASACNGGSTPHIVGRSTASSPSGPPSTARRTASTKKERTIPIPVPDIPPRLRIVSESAAAASTTATDGAALTVSYNSGVFAPMPSPRRREFVIHPEWASEVNAQGSLPPLCHPFTAVPPSPRPPPEVAPLWPKRCKSAPPPMYRNPITWE